MGNIYIASYVCKSMTKIGMPGYGDVSLGLSMGNGHSGVIIKGTCARFEVGKEYIVNIVEKEEGA